jgi:predicted nucleotidyltransferase component of viral defense system
MEGSPMIKPSELKRAAVKEGIPQAVVEKDIALSAALKAISESDLTRHLVFKGGTAIKKVYFKEARFSEDLDFSVFETEKGRCVDMLRDALEGTGVEGIEFEKIEEEETSAGLKASVRFIGPLAHPQRIRFDLSFRDNLVEEPTRRRIIDTYGFGPAESQVMSLEEILAEKLHALGNRSAARDLYDVWFLFGKGIEIDEKVLEKKFAYYGERYDAKKTIENARKSKENWTRDLKNLIRELPPYDPLEKMVETRLLEIPRVL